MRPLKLTFLVFLFSSGVTAQNLNGVWQGYLGLQPVMLELYVYDDTMVSGVTHMEIPFTTKYEHYLVSGKYDPKIGTIQINENTLANAFVYQLSNECTGDYNLFINQERNEITLSGLWLINQNSLQGCPTSAVKFSRVQDKKFHRQEINSNGKFVDFQAFCEIFTASKKPLVIKFNYSGKENGKKVSIRVAGENAVHYLDAQQKEVEIQMQGNKLNGFKKLLLETEAEAGENLVTVEVKQGNNTGTFLLAPANDRISVFELYFSYDKKVNKPFENSNHRNHYPRVPQTIQPTIPPSAPRPKPYIRHNPPI